MVTSLESVLNYARREKADNSRQETKTCRLFGTSLRNLDWHQGKHGRRSTGRGSVQKSGDLPTYLRQAIPT